jgi:hypothetical protein
MPQPRGKEVHHASLASNDMPIFLSPCEDSLGLAGLLMEYACVSVLSNPPSAEMDWQFEYLSPPRAGKIIS